MRAERFAPGEPVRVRLDDPRTHTRAPRYVRGRQGTVVEVHGHHPLPDEVTSGRRPTPSPVYAVAFDAAELFGEGDHDVVVNLWEAYLVSASEQPIPEGASPLVSASEQPIPEGSQP